MNDGTDSTRKPSVFLRIASCFRSALVRFIANSGPVMSGHLAFIGLLSFFPFLIFLTALAGIFGQTELGTYFVAFLFEQMPEQVSDVLSVPLLEVLQETRGELLTMGILLSIWTASSGLEAARMSLNRAYISDRRRPMWLNRIESIVLVILVSTFIIIAMFGLVLGPMAREKLEAYVKLPAVLEQFWTIGHYGIGALLIFIAITALYFLLPAAKLKPRWVFPGALVVVLLWMSTATGFSVYVSQFGDYTVTYGSLAGIIITLLFFYVLAAIFIFGAEFNAAIARSEGGLALPQRRQLDRERRAGTASN